MFESRREAADSLFPNFSLRFTHPPRNSPLLPSGLAGPHRPMSIPIPPVSQAEVVLDGRAIWNAHLRACLWIVQDATVWPADTFPLWGTSVLKKHRSPELVEDDGVHGAGWQGSAASPQRFGPGPPVTPQQGSGSRRSRRFTLLPTVLRFPQLMSPELDGDSGAAELRARAGLLLVD